MALLYGRAGRLKAKNGGPRPGRAVFANLVGIATGYLFCVCSGPPARAGRLSALRVFPQ
jgi:hypothetical protein